MCDKDTVEINLLKNKYKMDDAAWILQKRSKNFQIKNMNLLFYPYQRILYLVDMGQRLSRLNEQVIMMVDLYTGRKSVAKSKGKVVPMDAEKKHVMPVKIPREDALKGNEIEIGGIIMGRKKVLKIPDIRYQSDELIYKPFFIVECINEEGEPFHILFDTVLGDFSLLNA